MNEQEAAESLAQEYRDKFGEEPDVVAQLMCKSMAKRRAAGEKIVWLQDGANWRTLGVAPEVV